jgi:predicted nucleotidyltransferase
MGTFSPAGRASIGLADALFTRVQQRVLGLLFSDPGRTFFAREIIRLAGSGTGAVQRELALLAGARLVTVKRVGNQVHYRANPDSPVFDELRGLVVKTCGIVDVIRAALAPHVDEIDAAFVFGSVAKGNDTASSDVDLMIITDSLGYPEMYRLLEESTRKLGRTVNPTRYSRKELARRIATGNAFVTQVLAGPKRWICGDESALTAREPGSIGGDASSGET